MYGAQYKSAAMSAPVSMGGVYDMYGVQYKSAAMSAPVARWVLHSCNTAQLPDIALAPVPSRVALFLLPTVNYGYILGRGSVNGKGSWAQNQTDFLLIQERATKLQHFTMEIQSGKTVVEMFSYLKNSSSE